MYFDMFERFLERASDFWGIFLVVSTRLLNLLAQFVFPVSVWSGVKCRFNSVKDE